MKNLIVLASLLVGFSLSSQAQNQSHNFYLENGKIIWQKIFTTKLNFEQLVVQIKESGILKNTENIQGKIIGQTKLINPDFKGAGFRSSSVPILVLRYNLDGIAIIEFKKGKYRVTLKDLNLTDKYNNLYSRKGGTPIEKMVLKSGKNEFRKYFTKSPSKIFDYTFSKLFNFQPDSLNKNW